MARAGFVVRFLKLCAVAVFVAVVAACGGGGAPSSPELVRITIAGMPGAPLAPMETVQLTANAIYSDGSARDVTGIATWDSTDRSVLTVSATGLVTAMGPGQAAASAAFGGVSSSVGAQVLGLPASYFSDGVEYAFDYQLDAQGRVDSYRISQREGVVYPVAAAGDVNVSECTGSLSGSYRCDGWKVYMTGGAGRLVAVGDSIGATFTTYSYEELGLLEVKESWRVGSHKSTDSTSTLSYDAAGRLSEVRTSSVIVDWSSWTQSTTATIEVDSQGRLLRAGIVTCSSWNGCWERSTAWTYDLAGLMSSAGTTTFSADADGWLVSRQVGSDTPDTYAIVRSGGRVVEEQFTQAFPSLFYGLSRPQRVRYQLGRLPVEPLFVPRALTGLSGADYFGIISSHNR